MESMYQRGKIQEESLYYETLKDNGEFPIIGVNTYLAPNIDEQMGQEIEISRCSSDEKMEQITRLNNFKTANKDKTQEALDSLVQTVIDNGNVFEELLKTVNYCSLGQITHALFEVGGRYRRNM